MSAKKRVAVAMSGGVDSSVAALVLKEQGFEVFGLMLRLWSEPGREDSNRCCQPEAVGLARRAAGILDIPFHVLDAKAVFRNIVVQEFMDGYARGGTPNPCIECNRRIRWEFLFEHAKAMGAEFMATGHYARLRIQGSGPVQLLRGVDRSKDQSYVLYTLDQEKLRHALFPVGEYTKREVREIARTRGLPSAARQDSQDLCFLGGGDYRSFLRSHLPAVFAAGQIVNPMGEVLGTHGGLADYTIGQRKGLGITSSEPLYVLRKEPAANRLVVGPAGELGQSELRATRVHWSSGSPPARGFRAQVKTRYTAAPAAGMVLLAEDQDEVRACFDEPQRDITPGQAAVFYDEEHLIGGGIIQ
jgi:tRNA-specific 2-thiouridylase